MHVYSYMACEGLILSYDQIVYIHYDFWRAINSQKSIQVNDYNGASDIFLLWFLDRVP